MENFFDVLPNVLILVNCWYVTKIDSGSELTPSFSTELPAEENIHNQYFWKIQAFAGIAIWAKFFIFLRVFDSTAFLIHMIQEVVNSLGPFMVILIFSILGFTDAFYSMNKAYPEERQNEGLLTYSDSLFYSILNTFGEFDTDGFDTTGKGIFLLASFINLVILLNLVIAIISEVFADVNSRRLESFYSQRANLISETWQIFRCYRNDPQAANKLLFFATETSVEQIKVELAAKQANEESANAEK